MKPSLKIYPKFIPVILFLLSTTVIFAQQEKNDLLLGGYFQGNTSSLKGAANTNLNLNFEFQAGFFVHDRLAVGSYFPIAYESADLFNRENFFSQKGLSPFIQYHFSPLDNRLIGFAWIQTGFSFVNNARLDVSTGTPSVVTAAATYWEAGGGIGCNYFPAEKIALNFAFKYQYNNLISGDLFYPAPNFVLKVGLVFLHPLKNKKR